ncbi:CDP-alcohol phosphatidyltransferase family protein [Limibacillus halophilus]|uniref:Phosphatidylglycerophosphate synthase n=1 Tax=Limibacillus halophilus TaxID=1579333 RepID=A0A839SMN1_9PROT|nr:CDP-alcohol phosphatidyltransferase family protein [Limibacillus halophilus]MBB3064157.1 phosphatidylglycerophosphate synthase [Limibacillus halophilus]
MLDRILRPWVEPPLQRMARVTARLGVTANAVTLFGFLVGLLAIPTIANELYLIGLFFILANRVLDGLDGAVARIIGPSDLGGFLDIVLDFIFYAAVVFAFGLARPDDALAAAFLILSFVGTGSSFLAYAVFAAKRGMSTEIGGSKSLFYLGGLTEGSETILLFVIFCLFPDSFATVALIFGAACWITSVSRILAAVRTFR